MTRNTIQDIYMARDNGNMPCEIVKTLKYIFLLLLNPNFNYSIIINNLVTWRVGVSGKYSRPLSKWLGVRSLTLANGANSQASCLPPIWDFRTAND